MFTIEFSLGAYCVICASFSNDSKSSGKSAILESLVFKYSVPAISLSVQYSCFEFGIKRTCRYISLKI